MHVFYLLKCDMEQNKKNVSLGVKCIYTTNTLINDHNGTVKYLFLPLHPL